MQNLPPTFWAQLFARIRAKSPKFYSIIITNSLLFTLAAVAFPFVVTDLLPGIGVTVPQWLTYANDKVVAVCTFLAGLGVGGAMVGTTTIQTKETPHLVSTASETPGVLERLAELESELADLKAARGNNPL